MEIITNTANLEEAKPYEFITENSIDTSSGAEVIKNLLATMEEHKEIISLAAPQIGSSLRIFCIRFDDIIKTFVNPIIIRKSGQTVLPETCASLPGKEYIIGRPAEITAVYYNEDFRYEENKFLGQAARIFDQNVQLLDGILPTLFGLESDVAEDGTWSEATEEELREVQKFYLEEYIPKLKKAYEDNINQNEDLAKQYKLYKVSEDVINDRTQIVDGKATQQVIDQARAAAKQKQYAKKMQFKAFAGKKTR